MTDTDRVMRSGTGGLTPAEPAPDDVSRARTRDIVPKDLGPVTERSVWDALAERRRTPVGGEDLTDHPASLYAPPDGFLSPVIGPIASVPAMWRDYLMGCRLVGETARHPALTVCLFITGFPIACAATVNHLFQQVLQRQGRAYATAVIVFLIYLAHHFLHH